jgi:hypothetical protein
MPIAMIFDAPGQTVERNDRVLEHLRQQGVTMPVAGQLVHLAGPYEGGWRVIDVWESQADADRFFTDHLESAFRETGGMLDAPPPPQVFPVHDLYT